MVKNLSKKLINHLGLTLMEEDLQNVVELMEPYGQISNGMELLNPPCEVGYHFLSSFYIILFFLISCFERFNNKVTLFSS